MWKPRSSSLKCLGINCLHCGTTGAGRVRKKEKNNKTGPAGILEIIITINNNSHKDGDMR